MTTRLFDYKEIDKTRQDKMNNNNKSNSFQILKSCLLAITRAKRMFWSKWLLKLMKSWILKNCRYLGDSAGLGWERLYYNITWSMRRELFQKQTLDTTNKKKSLISRIHTGRRWTPEGRANKISNKIDTSKIYDSDLTLFTDRSINLIYE